MPNVKHGELLDTIRKSARIPDRVVLTPNSRFQEDLGIDSLDLVGVLLAIQDDLGIEFNDQEITGIHTVQDIIALLGNHGVSLQAA